MQSRLPRLDLVALLMGLAFSVMWSSAFATARVIVADAPPLWSLTFRFAISGGIAVAVALALGQSSRLTRPVALSVLLFGLCQNALYLGLNFIALQWVPAALASVIASSMPLIVAGFGWLAGRERPGALGLLGLALGFLGVALVMGSRITAGADPIGVALCLAAATALALATLTLRAASAQGNLLMIVGLQMWVGSASLALAAALTEPLAFRPTTPLFLAFAYQIFVPGLAATLLWFALVRRIGALRAATFHFLNPFFGVTIAALLLSESVTGMDLLGVAVAMAGILAVQLARAATPRLPDASA